MNPHYDSSKTEQGNSAPPQSDPPQTPVTSFGKYFSPAFSRLYDLKHSPAPSSYATMKPARHRNHRPASPRSRPFLFMTTPHQPGAHPSASTGPRSAEGKARSSMNALKSGIYSKSLTIPGEDPARLDTLLQEYFQRYRPALPEQRDQVDILVRSAWTLRRLAAAEAQVWTYEMDIRCQLHPTAPLGQAFHHGDRTLTRLQRMVNSTQRNFRDALHELERLQALAFDFDPHPAPEISPDSPTREPAPTARPDPQSDPQPTETK